MKIIVCVKPVFSTEENIIIQDSNCILPPKNGYVINPFDEYAIEEALKAKDENNDTHILSVSYGDEKSEAVVRSVLALGVDRAILTINDKTTLIIDSLRIANILYSSIKNESYDCILMGKESSDLQNSAVGPMLAGMLNIPVVTNVHSCVFDDNKVEVERYIQNGILQKLCIELPCVITVTKGVNKLRYASLSGIMRAKSKPLLRLLEEELAYSHQISSINLYYRQSRSDCEFITGDEGEVSSRLKKILRLEK